MRSRALELAAEIRESPTPRATRTRRRRRPSSSGSSTTSSPSSATASTSSSPRTASCASTQSPRAASGSCASRAARRACAASTSCRPACGALALEPHILNLTKANSRATVHRPAYLDYVGVKRFDDDGKVVGERRFLGLYTHEAYQVKPERDPDPAAQGSGGAGARRLPAREPQREGAGRDPRHLSARRALPDLGRRAVRGRDGHPPPRRAPAAAAVRAPRRVRALPLAARVRAARPLQHREPAPDRGHPA